MKLYETSSLCFGNTYIAIEINNFLNFFTGLKKYSNWPTYPQLYVNGELVGGLDIIKVLEFPTL